MKTHKSLAQVDHNMSGGIEQIQLTHLKTKLNATQNNVEQLRNDINLWMQQLGIMALVTNNPDINSICYTTWCTRTSN